MFFLRGRFWLTLAKLLALVFPTALFCVQIPEMRYDLGPSVPQEITTADQLSGGPLRDRTFVAVIGKVDPNRGVVYSTYGLTYTYLLIEPYGARMVMRVYGTIDDSWGDRNRFEGKLRYGRMAFRRTVRAAFREKHQIEIPANALFLAYHDNPALSGWNVAAVIFSAVMWLVMFYFFFLWPRPKVVTARPSSHPS